ncbi:hypothetical protein ELH66_08170 [Rhizobium ruizarguesonis]|uniref:tetratricopeptide repeat protein n=1 Tax=Rhizobium ruizarguesonis TaxID=2081791 RepID=UPI0010305DA4|nr:hypothetical protein [Rhizobium ruizarguesonis]TBA20973.1 hypothetical protein ELH66_08170 [Rhizobium ruizarguesonis]
MAYETILWTIILAFIATTLITLLALIKVIQIDRFYLRGLFTALVLEIVACGFLIFRHGFNDPALPSPELVYFEKAGNLHQSAARERASGNAQAAESDLRSIVRLRVENLPVQIPVVFKELGDLYFQRADWIGASHALAVYYEIDPGDFESSLQYGQALQHLKQYDESLPIFTRLSVENGSSTAVFYGLINVFRRKAAFDRFAKMPQLADGEFKKALDNAERVLSIVGPARTDEYAKAKETRANIHWEMGDKEVAAQQLAEVVSEVPSYTQAKQHLAALQLEMAIDRQDEAGISAARDAYSALYKNAVDDDRAFIGAGLAEATALSRGSSSDQRKVAKDAVLAAIATTPSDPYCSYAAALVFKASGDKERARKFILDAIKLERGRAINPFTFDYVRLAKYEGLETQWAAEGQQ